MSIIILTWNSYAKLQRCLRSLHENVQGVDYEVIVVDNGSRDGTLARLAGEFSWVTTIANTTNIGVAPARNQGIKRAIGDYVMLLDVDTEMPPGTVERMLAYMEANPAVGLIGPRLIYPNGDLQWSCRKYPLVQSKLARRLPEAWAARWLADEQYRDVDHQEVFPVDYVIGACQLIRRQVFAAAGLLDGRMFYGPEDVDFCLRVRLAGYGVVYFGQATVIHDEQRITKRRIWSRITWEHVKALCLYFAKHKYAFGRARLYRRISRTPQLPMKAGSCS